MALVMCITSLVILLSSVFLLYYLYILKTYRFWKNRGFHYIPPSIPFGNFPDVFTRKAFGVALKEIHLDMTTPYSGLFVLHRPILLVKDRELIRTIMVKDFHAFCDRTLIVDRHIDSVTSQMLFFNKNPEWRMMRKKISPAYTTSNLKSMYIFFANSGDDLVKYVSKSIEKSDVVNCKEFFVRYSTDVITSTAFGIDASCFAEDHSGFRDAALRIFDCESPSRAFSLLSYFVAPIFVKLFRLKFIDKETISFCRQAFWDTFHKREKSKAVRNDIIDILMQIHGTEITQGEYYFDDNTMLAQAMSLFLAGFETTSTAATFCLCELAKCKDIQSKLREELRDALSVHGSFSYDLFTQSLPYLDMVVKETLRKYPVAPYLDRKCCQDYTIPGTSKILEKELGVYISVLGLHMDPENFPEPEKFIPERFSLENMKYIKPFSYIPFGEGLRSCIGSKFGILGVKTSIANIIVNFDVELQDRSAEMGFHRRGFFLSPNYENVFLKFKKVA